MKTERFFWLLALALVSLLPFAFSRHEGQPSTNNEVSFTIDNDETAIGAWDPDAKGGIEFRLQGLARFPERNRVGYVGTSATLIQKINRDCCRTMKLTAHKQVLLAKCNQDTVECEPVKWQQLPDISYVEQGNVP